MAVMEAVAAAGAAVVVGDRSANRKASCNFPLSVGKRCDSVDMVQVDGLGGFYETSISCYHIMFIHKYIYRDSRQYISMQR